MSNDTVSQPRATVCESLELASWAPGPAYHRKSHAGAGEQQARLGTGNIRFFLRISAIFSICRMLISLVHFLCETATRRMAHRWCLGRTAARYDTGGAPCRTWAGGRRTFPAPSAHVLPELLNFDERLRGRQPAMCSAATYTAVCPAATHKTTRGSKTYVQKFLHVHACAGVWSTPYEAWHSCPWVGPHGARTRLDLCRTRHDHLARITGVLCGQSSPVWGHRVVHGGMAYAPPGTTWASAHVQRSTA
jgi:hypothetical protein